ncbi:MAG: ribbon-helix-helix protein, CopG family [bacterium]
MSQTLIISDTLYARLEATARARGLSSIEELIEQLIEMWQSGVDELRRRQEVVGRIDALRKRLFATYGEMMDSVELIRADRER